MFFSHQLKKCRLLIEKGSLFTHPIFVSLIEDLFRDLLKDVEVLSNEVRTRQITCVFFSYQSFNSGLAGVITQVFCDFIEALGRLGRYNANSTGSAYLIQAMTVC